MLRSQLGGEFCGLAVECDGGPPSRHTAYLDIAPCHPVVLTCPDGFHGRFLGGEARGIALYSIGFRIAIANLAFRKDPADKSVSKALDRFCDARYFRDVNPAADDHFAKLTQCGLNWMLHSTSRANDPRDRLPDHRSIELQPLTDAASQGRFRQCAALRDRARPASRKPNAMAAEIQPFRAHISCAGMLGKPDEFVDRVLKIFGEHVVGIIPEAWAA